MPSTKEKSSQRAIVPQPYGAGGEPPGEPPAPPLRSAESSRLLSEEVVEEALGRARLRRSVAGMSDTEREELIDGLLDQLRAERDELPNELRERLLDGMIDELIAGKRGEREILGQNGVLGEITRRMVQRALEEELTEHLGYPAGQAPPGGVGNSRNGGTPKTLLTDQGPVPIDTPRDRKARFEPQLVKKGQRRLAGLDEKIIALYAGGMSTREIETYITELYGPGVSRETVSRVTAAVLEDAKAWQTRPLEQIYPIVYLDALVIKIRDGQAVRNFACYLAIGVNLEGDRDVLGIWFQRTEGAKFWLQVLTDLKQRGVQDVLVCCVDGLQGFPEAIASVYPQTVVQTCIVHLIRNSLAFVAWKDRKAILPAIKAIYRAENADMALIRLEEFEDEWGKRYPAIGQAWRRAWEHVVPFFAFAPGVRKMIYTTNAVEALHRSLRKIIKTRGSFPNDDAALKLLYLAIKNAGLRWRRGVEWTAAMGQFAIQFGSRFPGSAR